MVSAEVHILYRFYDEAGQLLYIGLTSDPGSRMTAHSQGKPWWQSVRNITMQNFSSRTELMRAERDAIKREDPLFNIVHSKRPAKRRPGWGTAVARPATATRPSRQEELWDWMVWQRWLFLTDPNRTDGSDQDEDSAWKRWLDQAAYHQWLAA